MGLYMRNCSHVDTRAYRMYNAGFTFYSDYENT